MVSPYDQDSDDRIYTPTPGFRFSGLLKKELREILRDRRTVITLILMPLLVYPLLGLLLQKFFLSQMSQLSKVEYRIILPNEAEGQLFRAVLTKGNRLLALSDSQAREKQQTTESGNQLAALQTVKPVIKFLIADNYGKNKNIEKLVREGLVDVGVRYTPIDTLQANQKRERHSGRFQIIYGAQSAHSRRVAEYVEKRLQAVRWDERDKILTRLGKSETVPFMTTLAPVKSEMSQGNSLVTFVPMILLLMTMTGAVYPAIDLTAGERERGTLETLMAAPLPRMWILCSKFFAVLTVATLTAVVNMVAMLATAYANGLEGMLFGEGLTPLVLLQILLLLLIFAAFFSAVLLCVTSFARSFKEAQAYLIPLMLISMAPGIIGLVPDLKMTLFWSVIPLANIVLLSRDFLLHQAHPALFFVSVFSTLFYGVVALSLAARIFGADTILYQSDASWSDLFKRSRRTHAAPALNNAVLCLAVLFPVFILTAAFVSRLQEFSMAMRLLISGTLTFCLFLLIPLLFAWLGGVNLKSGFRWYLPRPLACVGAVLLGFTLWPIAYEIEIFALTDFRIEILTRLFDSMKLELELVPLWIKLVSLAVLPAVCEELFFRGYLLSGLLNRFSSTRAIFLSAFLFALFHVVVRDSLFIERFFPSFFMGICLGYVNVLSRSVIPGIVLHMLHNGLLITFANFQEYFSQWEMNLQNQKHLPLVWLLVSLGFVVVGFALVWLSNRNEKPDEALVSVSPPTAG
ncbi:ABC transporter permease subunit/CPBP intramembrane protease [Gimesia panareensis]|uniref:ABC-2 family transporter protein n=1 Tax=Gimesia panareensis TaxID=2527978 RepID=A0A518A9Y5_9PLAN|nr:ABC transporter permease subunit/CPBP intramembrane protease [Gimesia panareensis]QDT28661.1 ABC-2 family transporter protein [Gimesia panareensis]QDU51514.1 ABC-2 family transporter protein [Gimesia panareensis]QDV19403.1 ABC-2 family transporter protein [Gimesia panareensis]